MPKAYSYIRFSSASQADGDSLRRQVEKAERWARERGLQIDETLRELGVSAHRGAHVEHGTALRRFLDHVQSGRIERGSYLIVESMDRLSREAVMQALPRFIDILNAGIVVVTLTDGQVYSKESIDQNPYQIMVSLGPMIRSHEESALKSVRVSEAWAKKRERARAGEHKMTRRTPEWIKLEGGKFVLRTERVDIVRRIFRETIEGYGRRTIARRLNMEGVPTFRAHEKRKKQPAGWQDSSVGKILCNRAVFGEFQPGTGTTKYGTHRPEGAPIKDYYPAVVEEDVFWQAQAVIASRRRIMDADGKILQRGTAGRRGQGISHLLIGLGRCDRCKGPMHIVNKGRPPKGAMYFECSTARMKAHCENDRRWRVDAIERRLLKHLTYINADVVLGCQTAVNELQRVEGSRARLAAAEKQRDAVLRIVKTGDEAAIREFEQLAIEVKDAAAELSKAEAALAQATATPGLRARLVATTDLNRAMDGTTGDERAAIRTRLAEQLRQLVEVVRFDPELGVDAILKVRPDVPEDQIPFVYGSTKAIPWRLWLDEDGDPSGVELWQEQDTSDPFPASLARKLDAARKG